MDKEKAISYIENSFLNRFVFDKDITDVSFNGQDIYYVSNSKGRLKSDIILNNQEARDFIRQIANICESQFSYTSPVIDLSIGRYRINAIHHSIAKINDEGVITFSIRFASRETRINSKSDFFTPQIVRFIDVLLKQNVSIIIGGVTSSGKTEFQKYLLSNLPSFSRVIVIDNVMELDQVRSDNIDLTCWKADEKNPNAQPNLLIKNALRNNPDWLILAEARDKEMVDVLNSAMTGMPIITTLHSKDVFSLPHRMGRMMMKAEQKIDFSEALNDIYYHFHFYFYLTKCIEKDKVKRFISQIAFVNSKGQATLLFNRNGNKCEYYEPNEEIANELKIDLRTLKEIFTK